MEAEDADLVIAKKATDHSNYSGTGFVDNYNTGNIGAATTFTVYMASAGPANITLRYANGSGSSKTLSLYVNGVKIKQTSLPATANWDTWGNKAESLTLKAGSNTIAYKYDAGDTANVNLDYISYAGGTSPPPTPTTKAEAENAALVIAKKATDHSNYSGTGFVDNYNTGNIGASTTFTVYTASAGLSNVTLRYSNGMGISETLSLYVNGVKIKQTSLPATANWDTWGDKTESLNLNAGFNTIAYKYDVGDTANVNLDYILMSTPTP
ncbi:carbohydrate-binding protein [Cohnella endophytica]|uniref:Carbohydrate-binding protein n=1 Tax=Cohnella endophytica TaxID=2419778 RepID=A0A494XF59_9BACL|nr:carbohydrate-binding protein [Cohnella endophytica]